ncbi:MAG: hypothetical protein P8K08_02110 [Fuerstiella sp.]|jgi:hypothetical protein|nr:hypothetical protein [Fuerstiella sp.]
MNSPKVTRIWQCVTGLSLAFVIGCGEASDRPETYPVSGTVVYNGDPVEGASVAFWKEGAARAATGVTNAEGKFQLSMYELNDGAIQGSQIVTVSKLQGGAAATTQMSTETMNDASAMAEMMAAAGSDGPKASKSLLPEKYSSQTTSPLKETVAAGGENTFVLQLTD